MSKNIFPIVGGAGGGEPDSPTQTDDNLFSEDIVEFALAVSEGPIRGLTQGAKSFNVGDTPLVAQDGTPNFAKFAIGVHPGYTEDAAKPLEFKLGGASSNESVGVTLQKNVAVLRQTSSVLRNTIDQLEVRIYFQRLLYAGSDGGTDYETAHFRVEYKKVSDSTWLKLNGSDTAIRGKTSSGYAKDFNISVPRVNEDWMIRVTKLSDDNSTTNIVELAWESFQCVSKESRKYPRVALVHGIGVANGQFSSIPEFSGVFDGLIVRVPTNYNPDTRSYDETTPWNGGFKFEWTNNPAWLLYHLIVDETHGLAGYYPYVDANRFDFYEAAKWCDQPVSIGTSTQPRFTFNMVLIEPRSALEMLAYIAGSFNALIYDDLSGKIHLKVDRDDTADLIFTPENVSAEGFNYTYTDITSRVNDVSVAFINPNLDWNEDRRRVVGITTNEAAIAKFGRIPLDFIAVGCTDEFEALRRANYRLVSSQTEKTMVDFTTTRLGVLLRLYEVILVADPTMGWSQPGRIKSYDSNFIYLRDPIFIETNEPYVLKLQTTSGIVEVNVLVEEIGYVSRLVLAEAMPASETVPEYATFALEQAGGFGFAKPFRVLSVEPVDGSPHAFAVQALEINRNKYSESHDLQSLPSFQYSYKEPVLPSEPQAVEARSGSNYAMVSPTGDTVDRIFVTWRAPSLSSAIIGYEVQWKATTESQWQVSTANGEMAYLSPVIQGLEYDIQVRSVTAYTKSRWIPAATHTVAPRNIKPSTPMYLMAFGGLLKNKVDWEFGSSPDYKLVEVWGGSNSNVETFSKLTDVSFPQSDWEHLGLGVGQIFYYRVRALSKSNAYSEWSSVVNATTNTAPGPILGLLTNQIGLSQITSDLSTPIGLVTAADTVAGSVAQRVKAESDARLAQLAAMGGENLYSWGDIAALPGAYGASPPGWVLAPGSNPHRLQPGETLTISADIWQDAASVADGNSCVLFLWCQSATEWSRQVNISTISTTPGRASATMVLPTNPAEMVHVGVGVYHVGGAGAFLGTVHADRIQVERGTTATAYKQATQAAIQRIVDLESTVQGPNGVVATAQALDQVETIVGDSSSGNAALAQRTQSLESSVNDTVGSGLRALLLNQYSTTAQTGLAIANATSTVQAVAERGVNLADVDWWAPGASLPPGWSWNGDASENSFISGVDHTGKSATLLRTISAPGGLAGADDGGWNNGAFLVQPNRNKTYRFVVPVLKPAGAENGTAYWGIQPNSVCDLNTTSPNGNPYFAYYGALPVGVWCLMVGYVFPAGATGRTSDGSGIYRIDTGELISGGNNFCWHPSNPTSYRAYQYYSGAGSEMRFAKPLVHLTDGSEPPLEALLSTSRTLAAQITSERNAAVGREQAIAEDVIEVAARLAPGGNVYESLVQVSNTATSALDRADDAYELADTTASQVTTVQSRIADGDLAAFSAVRAFEFQSNTSTEDWGGYGGGSAYGTWAAGSGVITGTSNAVGDLILERYFNGSQALDGATVNKVRVRLKKPVSGGIWNGTLFFANSSHGQVWGQHLQVPEPSWDSNGWAIVEWNMLGVGDWSTSSIINLRFDFWRNSSGPQITAQVDWVAIGARGVGISYSTVQQSLSTLTTATGQALAKYSLQLDVNGYTTGWTADNDGQTGNIVFLTNTFSIAKAGSPGVYPFIVGTVGGVNTVGINGQLVVDGSITAGAINTNGLTVKDLSGNVILSSGVNLNVSRVSGLGGLATVSQLNASNISTYIANLSVGSLQIANGSVIVSVASTSYGAVTINDPYGEVFTNGYYFKEVESTSITVVLDSTFTTNPTAVLNVRMSGQLGLYGFWSGASSGNARFVVGARLKRTTNGVTTLLFEREFETILSTSLPYYGNSWMDHKFTVAADVNQNPGAGTHVYSFHIYRKRYLNAAGNGGADPVSSAYVRGPSIVATGAKK